MSNPESAVQREIMLAVGSMTGVRVFRNNCGALQDARGKWIRYGVASPGGADLIGWREVVITPDMVGMTMAQFVALEIKTETGNTTKEQDMFIAAVRRSGGIGEVVRSSIDAAKCVKG